MSPSTSGSVLTNRRGPSTSSQSRRLSQPDHVAVRVLYRGDQLPPTDVFDLLQCLRAGVEEELQALPDVVHVPVARHPVTVTLGIQARVLASDTEADIVGVIV